MAHSSNQTLGKLQGLKQDPPVINAKPRNNETSNDYVNILFH
jgi:hypothetical protein